MYCSQNGTDLTADESSLTCHDEQTPTDIEVGYLIIITLLLNNKNNDETTFVN